MSHRASPLLGRAAWAPALVLAASLAGCAKDSAPLPIAPEPRAPLTESVPDLPPAPVPRDDARPPHTQGVRAETFTFESAAIGFKMAVAVPENGQLCIIVPESAQDPTACIGLDPTAMIEALPKGADAPFGVAYARAGDWSYIVMLSPMPPNVEAREDIEEIVGGAEKAVKEASSLDPKVIADTPGARFDILRVKDVPIVKFRIDAPHPADKPEYELATTLYYAAYGGKAAMVTFLTSPKDIDKVMPYAEASIRTLELPPREVPERFGKPRAELSQQGTRTALMIFGPLVALGVLLFWWLGKTRNAEGSQGDTSPAKPRKKGENKGEKRGDSGGSHKAKSRPNVEPATSASPEAEDAADPEDDASSSEAEDDEDDKDDAPPSDREDDEDAPTSDAKNEDGAPSSDAKNEDGAPSEDDAPPSDPAPKK